MLSRHPIYRAALRSRSLTHTGSATALKFVTAQRPFVCRIQAQPQILALCRSQTSGSKKTACPKVYHYLFLIFISHEKSFPPGYDALPRQKEAKVPPDKLQLLLLRNLRLRIGSEMSQYLSDRISLGSGDVAIFGGDARTGLPRRQMISPAALSLPVAAPPAAS